MKKGTTRLVFIVGGYAIKIPRPNRWKSFLRGILANLDEKLWYKNSPTKWKEMLCPVIGCYFGGFILVMRKAKSLNPIEYLNVDVKKFYCLPMDKKISNFGIINNKVVLIDYADSRYFCSDCENILKQKLI